MTMRRTTWGGLRRGGPGRLSCAGTARTSTPWTDRCNCIHMSISCALVRICWLKHTILFTVQEWPQVHEVLVTVELKTADILLEMYKIYVIWNDWLTCIPTIIKKAQRAPARPGSGEGCQWQALPSPVQCEETATRTRDLPVTGGKTLPLAPGPPFK